jgi:hypothetical protein
MTVTRKLLLCFGVAIIGTLFYVASRPPEEAELEYRPPAQNPDQVRAAITRDRASAREGLAVDQRPPSPE